MTNKEKPISFSAPMVRAILDGRKTQTRRCVKILDGGLVKYPGSSERWCLDDVNVVLACSHGQPGDRLWVRERIRILNRTSRLDGVECKVRYEADGEIRVVEYPSRLALARVGTCMPNGCYREASRIVLEIVSVRVEHLCDISEEDARAEGVDPSIVGEKWNFLEYRAGLETLWNEIYGAGSFRKNPWVWVIEFRRI